VLPLRLGLDAETWSVTGSSWGKQVSFFQRICFPLPWNRRLNCGQNSDLIHCSNALDSEWLLAKTKYAWEDYIFPLLGSG